MINKQPHFILNVICFYDEGWLIKVMSSSFLSVLFKRHRPLMRFTISLCIFMRIKSTLIGVETLALAKEKSSFSHLVGKHEKQTLVIYHEVCALLVSAEKWVRLPCNSIPMPPARYMLKHEIRKVIEMF